MIKKGTTLDTGNPTQLRIKKIDALRTSTKHIFELLDTYCTGIESIAGIERRLAAELRIFYSRETNYFATMDAASNFLERRSEIAMSGIKDLRNELLSARSIKKNFDSLIPHSKTYLKNFNKIDHYTQKVNKISLECDGLRISKGEVSSRKAAWLTRNQKKLEDCKSAAFVSANTLQESTNRVNLERFDKINPVISLFIAHELTLSEMPQEITQPVLGFKEVLSQKATSRLNDIFFVHISSLNANNTPGADGVISSLGEGRSEPSRVYKKNVQNNYYILATEKYGQDLAEKTRTESSFTKVMRQETQAFKGGVQENQIQAYEQPLALENPVPKNQSNQIVSYKQNSETHRALFGA